MIANEWYLLFLNRNFPTFFWWSPSSRIDRKFCWFFFFFFLLLISIHFLSWSSFFFNNHFVFVPNHQKCMTIPNAQRYHEIFILLHKPIDWLIENDMISIYTCDHYQSNKPSWHWKTKNKDVHTYMIWNSYSAFLSFIFHSWTAKKIPFYELSVTISNHV